MFRSLKNIESAFKYVRLFTLVVICASATVSCYTMFVAIDKVQQSQQRIYLLYNGKVLEAVASGRKENVPVEARDHISTFHKYFFSLDPDEKVIENNLRKALYLADRSAKKIYDDLKEQGYYSGIITGNVTQEIEADSIQVDISNYPYRFRYYGTQRITRTTTVVLRSLVTEGHLRTVARSDNNPHGFLIERWAILENVDLQTIKR
ncbi:conjugative transposon protein TraK [Chitinophaga tropicalis]|uniref:Conjugative transposon protein TraK n=1 Tax=Chitinophaga tropicalis TaxID=2683588 RepID=A0A7K1U004_9BACT|nr:conjugative transposon protein TraK [Chitinophaga tropicalis]MVT07697.1 conjugative transposon protein TraK [Chitinophaga tropicalis]